MLEILEIGSGTNYYKAKENENVTHLDNFSLPHVEKVWDLEKSPLPFKDEKFDVIIAYEVLEHVENFFELMNELHRILKPNGIVKITVPYFSDVSQYANPTHRRFFTLFTFDYFTKEWVKENYYTSKFWKVKTRKLLFFRPILKQIAFLFNKFQGFYHLHLSYIFPASTIYFELEKAAT